ncbi:MAG: AMP-binding protein, partial [Clostridia bacterium]|nr:AMP-binding protein [Clostridia bacterium]
MENQITGLDFKIKEMASRIKDLREIEALTPAEMAAKTDVTTEEYLACERGEKDLNCAFIYRCALAFNVDVTDIIEGTSPKLAAFTVTRNGEGQKIEQAHGMVYYNLASAFRNRIAEPLYVRAAYSEEAERRDIELTTHEGQECDIVIRGSLKVQVGEHKVILNEGDSIYYDSSTPHGMIATGGEDCLFYAMVLNPSGEPIPELTAAKASVVDKPKRAEKTEPRVYEKWVNTEEDENGVLQKISFNNENEFNFAFDVVDALAQEKPEKLAMLHLDKEKTERRFTFRDISRASNQCANYFKSLGIEKGDRVMLVLKRHYQFWFAAIGLHKLGAVMIPATNQLKSHDFEYRFKAAGVKAIVCTSDDGTAEEADIAAAECPTLEHKIIVGEKREGWRNFDAEYNLYSTRFERTADSPKGNDLLLMFFTSGTTGYPKIAAHNHKYALGHFLTARYWHCVDPDGLHLTISDTG